VDDTIHLYHGYLHRIRHGVSPVFAIIRSVESSGRAVIAISVVLIAQFSLLGLSDFRPTAHPRTSAPCARSACSQVRCSSCC